MPKPDRRKLERVRYWQGQMLRSQDFLNLQGVEAQRRWWHNRAIHNAYGIAEGLEATLVPASAPTGVCISPGVAYDTFGRELILERTQTVPLPNSQTPLANNPAGAAVRLLMRYRPPSRRLHPDEISEVCWTAPGSVVAGTAEFVWKLGGNLSPAEGVAVYAVSYNSGTVTGPDQNYIRISAEPLARPLLAGGATVPGNTPWEAWSSPPSPNDPSPLLGVQTWVDTTSAGFTDVPCYFAWIEGPLFNAQSLWLLPALLPNVTDASITGFTFRMWLPPPPPTTYGIVYHPMRELLADANLDSNLVPATLFDLFAQQQNLYISWMGCQTLGRACACSQATAAQSSTSAQKT